MKKIIASLVCLLCPLVVIQANLNIEGLYRGKGYNPSGQSYIAEATIQKNGSAYVVNWTFQGDQGKTYDVGFGIVKGHQLSIVYETLSSSTPFGVQVYEIDECGAQLQGPWLDFGTTEQGYEKLKKIKE